MESLTHVQGVVAVLGLNADPEVVDRVDVGIGYSRSVADSTPGPALTIDQSVAYVHSVVVIAGALVSSLSALVKFCEVLYKLDGILADSLTLGAWGDENVVIGVCGSNEFEEEVGPVGINPVDSGEGGNKVFVGDPYEPAEPDFFGLDGHEEVEGVRAEGLVHVVLDIFGVGSDVALVEGAGGVGEVDEVGEVSGLNSCPAEVAELQGVFGGRELGLYSRLDESRKRECCQCKNAEKALHLICRFQINSN